MIELVLVLQRKGGMRDEPDVYKRQVQKPEVIEKTTDSIKLRTEQDFEYAIETEKDNSRIWKWAETGQYDKASRTVVFTGLKPGKQYSFCLLYTS